MSWIILVVSGILEAVWATALGKSEGFTRLWPSIVFFVALVLSMGGLALALRDVPTGTGYAVWVGIGATLTVVYAMILSRATLVRIARERVQDGRGVGVGRCGRGELSAGYADGDVAEGSQGADEFADADPGGLLQVKLGLRGRSGRAAIAARAASLIQDRQDA